MRLGVDISQYGGDLDRATIDCWKTQGISHVVVQYSEKMDQHLRALQEAGGLEIEGYVYLYWGLSPWNQTPQQRTQAALSIAGNRISRLWLDAEDSMSPYREDQLKACAEVCDASGMPTGIYTGRWWWEPNTRNSRAFAHLPLWHAEYTTREGAPADLSKAPDFGSFTPYGGWQKPTIWQFQGTTTLCGHQVDINVLEDLPMAKPETDRPYTDEEWGQAEWAVLNALQRYGLLRWDDKATVRDLHPTDQEHVRRFLKWAAQELAQV